MTNEHYKMTEYEAIDVIEDWTKPYSGVESFCLGNAIKYIARAPYKEGVDDDISKAIWYLQRFLEIRDQRKQEAKTDAEIKHIIDEIGGNTTCEEKENTTTEDGTTEPTSGRYPWEKTKVDLKKQLELWSTDFDSPTVKNDNKTIIN